MCVGVAPGPSAAFSTNPIGLGKGIHGAGKDAIEITEEIGANAAGIRSVDVEAIAEGNRSVQDDALLWCRPTEAIPEGVIGVGVRAEEEAALGSELRLVNIYVLPSISGRGRKGRCKEIGVTAGGCVKTTLGMEKRNCDPAEHSRHAQQSNICTPHHTRGA